MAYDLPSSCGDRWCEVMIGGLQAGCSSERIVRQGGYGVDGSRSLSTFQSREEEKGANSF